MKFQLLLPAILLCMTGPLVASAEEPADGRFRLERSGDAFVRLDTRTGAMTLCREQDDALVCRMAADERAAYEEDLGRLEKRVAALEAAVAAGQPLAGRQREELPSDEEVERSIGIMERFMRSFFGLVEEFKSKEEKTGPAPDRT